MLLNALLKNRIMRLFVKIYILLTVLPLLSFVSDTPINYDREYVNISTVKHKGVDYKLIYMKRGESQNRIKAKYFAAKDPYKGTFVPDRYINWKANKSVICVTSGTYMDSYIDPKPIGLTVDNGIVVNRTLENDMDGLVIVYATGGIVATNIEDRDLVVQGGDIGGIQLNIKNNTFHRTKFLEWCQQNEATVFQTHLLVYKNSLKIDASTSKPDKRERRFLVVGHDEDGNLVHCIIHSPEYTSLYDGANKVYNFLNSFREMNIVFMVNLDTGAQDVFTLFDEAGKERHDVKGHLQIEKAINLLVYYYE